MNSFFLSATLAAMNNITTPLVLLLTASALVSGCARSVPVIGQSYSSQYSAPYYSRYTPQEAVFSRALDEAQQEAAMQEKAVMEDVVHQVEAVPVISSFHAGQTSSGLSDLWGQPPGSVGLGVTLMDSALRERFNDALNTTPLNGEAKWRYGGRTLIFLPNSDIYQPYRSGGNCRDGVFTHYNDAGTQETVRGLFCQQGRGADWFLIR